MSWSRTRPARRYSLRMSRRPVFLRATCYCRNPHILDSPTIWYRPIPFRNALNDCYAALKFMVTHADELGIRKDQIFVGGESAGGGLCAALCMLARNGGEVNIAFQMPLYPMIDDRDTDSSRDNHNLVWNTSGWLNSPEGTAPEVRNAPNRGRRRKSAGVKESRRG